MPEKSTNETYCEIKNKDEMYETGRNPMFGAIFNTLDNDKSGLQHTACQQTVCYVEQLESWFNAGQVAFFLRHLRCTSVPEASNLHLCCSSVSVKKTPKRLLRWSESNDTC